jgi:hypothetical protein
VQSWLITAFSLPVARSTGRLLLVSSGLLRHPLHMVALAVAVSIVVAVAGSRSLLRARHRRTLRRGPVS